MTDLLEGVENASLIAEVVKRLNTQAAVLKKQVEGLSDTLKSRYDELHSVTEQAENARLDLKDVLVRQQEAEDIRQQIIIDTSAKKDQAAADITTAQNNLLEAQDDIEKAKADKQLVVSDLDRTIEQKQAFIQQLESDIAGHNETIRSKMIVASNLDDAVELAKERQDKLVKDYDAVIGDKKGQVTRLDKRLIELKKRANEFAKGEQLKLQEFTDKRKELDEYEEKLNKLEQSLRIKADALIKDEQDLRERQHQFSSIDTLSKI